MRFDFLRLSLLRRSTDDLFAAKEVDGGVPERDEWLRRIFGQQIDFEHRRQAFHFVPNLSPPDPRYIFGKVGREVRVRENAPPSEGFEETDRDTWRAAIVIIDPTAHSDGQKAAVEHDATVGKPAAIFQSLVSRVNQADPPHPYALIGGPIIDTETFWQFVKDRKDGIVSVSFELVAPNMFGMRDAFDQELKEVRDKEKARRMTVGLHSDDGLQLDTDRVHRMVDYTAETGGTLRAKSKRGVRFSSQSKIHRALLDEEIGEEEQSFLQRAAWTLFGL